MSSKVSDKDVLQLFASLKSAESNYPQGMIESRRNTFAKQAAAMAILAKAGGSGGAASTTTGQAASTASSSAAGVGGASMGTILETALVITIVVEAGVAAYAYRDKIAQFIKSTFDPKVEQIASPPDNSSSDLITIEEEATNTLEETPTGIVTETETPVPPEFVAPGSDNNDDNNNSGDVQVASTPAPTDDSNGLHLGQTKQPTKEPKNNESNDSKDKDKKK